MKKRHACPRTHITCVEIKIHRGTIFAYIQRSADAVAWKVYQHVTPASVVRLTRAACAIAQREWEAGQWQAWRKAEPIREWEDVDEMEETEEAEPCNTPAPTTASPANAGACIGPPRRNGAGTCAAIAGARLTRPTSGIITPDSSPTTGARRRWGRWPRGCGITRTGSGG